MKAVIIWTLKGVDMCAITVEDTVKAVALSRAQTIANISRPLFGADEYRIQVWSRSHKAWVTDIKGRYDAS